MSRRPIEKAWAITETLKRTWSTNSASSFPLAIRALNRLKTMTKLNEAEKTTSEMVTIAATFSDFDP
jgi:hypothetical protein